ncbi:putative glutathione s [Rhypophila sp. PSN 637]
MPSAPDLKRQRGRFPMSKFHSSGEILGDSGFITKGLIAAGELEDLNAHLGPTERATDLAVTKAVEEGGYFITLYERWYENYYTMRDRGPFAPLPWGVRHLVTALAYRYTRVMLYMQGTGRYTAEEVTSLRGEMIGMLGDFAEASRARSAHEEDGPFWILGGEKPSEADFTVFGYLAGCVGTFTQPATTALIKSHPALIEYIERIQYRYFPDFELGDLQVAAKVHVE